MFKVSTKDTRTTPDVILVSFLLTLNIFHTLFGWAMPAGQSVSYFLTAAEKHIAIIVILPTDWVSFL